MTQLAIYTTADVSTAKYRSLNNIYNIYSVGIMLDKYM